MCAIKNKIFFKWWARKKFYISMSENITWTYSFNSSYVWYGNHNFNIDELNMSRLKCSNFTVDRMSKLLYMVTLPLCGKLDLTRGCYCKSGAILPQRRRRRRMRRRSSWAVKPLLLFSIISIKLHLCDSGLCCNSQLCHWSS